MLGRTNSAPPGGRYIITNKLGKDVQGVISAINGEEVDVGHQIILNAGEYIKITTGYPSINIQTEDGYDVPYEESGNFPKTFSSETVMRAPPMIQNFHAIMPNRNIIVS